MSSIAIRRAAWISVAILSGVIGNLIGSSRQLEATIRLLQVEAAGNVTQRIEALSVLRMGDTHGAIAQLESEVDQLAISIAANPGADRRVLAYVKTYLRVAPPSPSRAQQLSVALADVSTLPPGECKTALKALLASVNRAGAQ